MVSINILYINCCLIPLDIVLMYVEPDLLYLLLTNEPNMIDNITYSLGLGMSDHVCINFRLKYSSVHNVTKQPTFNFIMTELDFYERN